MCRRDPSTKKRHVQRHHPGRTVNEIQIYNFECHGSDLEQARQLYYKNINNSARCSEVPIAQKLISADATQSCVTPFKTTNEQFHTTSNKISKDDPNTVFGESNNTLCDKDKSNPVQTDLASLSIKVDQLIGTVKELEVSSFGPKDGKPVLRQAAMDFQVQNVDDWKDIKNIDLIDKIPVI